MKRVKQLGKWITRSPPEAVNGSTSVRSRKPSHNIQNPNARICPPQFRWFCDNFKWLIVTRCSYCSYCSFTYAIIVDSSRMDLWWPVQHSALPVTSALSARYTASGSQSQLWVNSEEAWHGLAVACCSFPKVNRCFLEKYQGKLRELAPPRLQRVLCLWHHTVQVHVLMANVEVSTLTKSRPSSNCWQSRQRRPL